MNKTFASVLALVAVAGAAVGAMPASAAYETVSKSGTGSTNLATTIVSNSGSVYGASPVGHTPSTLANSSSGATLTISSTVGAQYQSLVAVDCGVAGGASDYSIGFSNSVSCPNSATSLASSEALISVN